MHFNRNVRKTMRITTKRDKVVQNSNLDSIVSVRRAKWISVYCKTSQGGTLILGGRGLAPNFASEILVGAPNFASKNIGYKNPKFCPLNFRYDPKIGNFPQLLCFVVTEGPKFFLLFGELSWILPQILPPNLTWGPSPPPPRPPDMEVPPG